MLSYTVLIILGGCLIGAIQLLAGVAIGIWARCCADSRRGSQRELVQTNTIAKRLQQLASDMATSVGTHRKELDQASQTLSVDFASDDAAIADAVVHVIGDIVLANQSLQAKLDTAEGRLQDQASEIEAHICRSLTDPLTGLPNRREFNERVEERMAAWNRRHEVFSLLLLDIDHFKKLNDTYGHLAGDQVLATVGSALRTAVRREDAIARYGGEEFAVLLPSTGPEEAALVAQKVREAISGTVVIHRDHQIGVTASCGIASILLAEQAETLIQRADAALYAAKAGGRNCAYFHDGAECLLADGTTKLSSQRSKSELLALIHAPAAAKATVEDLDDSAIGFGTYLPRESISAALAEKCQELKRFLEQRSRPDASPASPQA